MAKTETAKKLRGSVVAVVILAACLCATTLALVFSAASVNNNLFHTGEAKINLNDGKAVIQEDEFVFEPGMTVTKDFFVENNGTWDVYYRLYFDDVSGGLADVLEVSIKDGDKVLCTGTVSGLSRQSATAADDTLKIGERRNLTMTFHYPEISGNETQGLNLAFTVCADATQTKNNPHRLFD